ncbi:hypothetical protein CEY16_06785 [Halalkalibacillus sediminis]|uniref:Lipoprotein n=1 Tax=Halalkalibacillus sediminis TaxID=2018042 RepID=A0A2I0QTG8_9BACI|nr:hypothetical protein [Halalkalibacillus sediminis]PKR77637.1 hypothetical protein CEY16_06785 [Halalkalibacillus sediminis]
MKKLLIAVLLIGALFLAACSESKSDKETVADGFDQLIEADTYEATSVVDLNVDVENMDPFMAPYIDMINNFEISADTKYDGEREMQETVLNMNGQMAPMSFDVSIPFLQDMKNQTMYVETDSLIENFSMMLGMIPEDLKGKLIKIDMNELEGYEEEQINYEDIQNQAIEVVNDYFDEKDEEDFSKEDDYYVVTFDEEDLKNLMERMMNELGDELGEEVTEEDIEQMKSDIDEMMEYVTINTLEVRNKMDGDYIENQIVNMDFSFDDKEGTAGDIQMAVDTTYQNYNGDIEFTIDPENSEVIDVQELESLMGPGF